MGITQLMIHTISMANRFSSYLLIVAVWLSFQSAMVVAIEQQNAASPHGLSVDQILEMKDLDLKASIEAEVGCGVEGWREKAEQMTPTQQYAIAELYLSAAVTGDVVKDREEAMFWLLKSAHRGLPAAQFRLGTWCGAPASIFELGHLITQTPEEAFHWYKLAAEAGYVRAFESLGSAYKHGQGCEKDLEAAKYWLKRAVLEHRSAYALEALSSLIDEKEMRSILLTLAKDSENNHIQLKIGRPIRK